MGVTVLLPAPPSPGPTRSPRSQGSGVVCAVTALRQTQQRCSSPATRNRIATARSVHAHAAASTRAGVPPNRTHASTVAGCGSFVIGRRSNSSSLLVSVSRRPDFASRSRMRWSIRLSTCSAYRLFVPTRPSPPSGLLPMAHRLHFSTNDRRSDISNARYYDRARRLQKREFIRQELLGEDRARSRSAGQPPGAPAAVIEHASKTTIASSSLGTTKDDGGNRVAWPQPTGFPVVGSAAAEPLPPWKLAARRHVNGAAVLGGRYQLHTVKRNGE